MKSRISLKQCAIAAVLMSSLSWSYAQNKSKSYTAASQYHKIAVKGNFAVKLVYSDERKVTIDAAEYPVDKIQIKESKLFKRITVSYPKGKSMGRDNVITFYGNHFEDIKITGDCELTASQQIQENKIKVVGVGNIKATLPVSVDKIDLQQKGEGSFTLTGSAKKASLHLDGRGQIYAANNFITSMVDAQLHGAGTIYSMPSQKLSAKVDGSGSVIYYGNVSNLAMNVKGSGKIVKGEDPSEAAPAEEKE